MTRAQVITFATNLASKLTNEELNTLCELMDMDHSDLLDTLDAINSQRNPIPNEDTDENY